MKKRHSFMEYLSSKDGDMGSIPFLPITELAGNQRVLIENHHGVTQYAPDTVGIRVKFGIILVCGCGLHISHMTKTKLLITGRIEMIKLERRPTP